MLYDPPWPSQIEYFQQTGQRLPDHRFVPRDPISLSSAILKEEGNGGEETEEKESKEELEQDERARGKEAASRKPLRMKEVSGGRAADTLTFLANGKNGMTDEGNMTPTKNEDKPSNQHGRHLNKEQHISQNKWMTERKLLDKNHRVSKDDTVAERKRKAVISKQVATGRMRRLEEDSASEGKYSSLHPCNSDERTPTTGNKWLRETMCGSEHRRKGLNRNEEWAKPRRAKYPTFRKHQQSGFQRKLLSLRGRQKPVGLEEGLRERTGTEEDIITPVKRNVYHDHESTLNGNDTSSLNFGIHFGPMNTNDHSVLKASRPSEKSTSNVKFIHISKQQLPAKYIPVQPGDYFGWIETEGKDQKSAAFSNESAGVRERDLDQLYLNHFLVYQNKRHKKYKRETIVNRLVSSEMTTGKMHKNRHKRDRSAIDKLAKRSEHMGVDRIIMSQLGEDLVYVRRYKAVGGRCEASSTFSVKKKEEEKEKEPERPEDGEKVNDEKRWWQMVQEMVEEMRREQVHVAETVVTVVVKDINDNAPVFPNATMFGEVQENGPIGELCYSLPTDKFDIKRRGTSDG